MDAGLEALPDDIEALKAALIDFRAEAAAARAQRSDESGADCSSEAADREAQPRSLWPALGAHRPASESV